MTINCWNCRREAHKSPMGDDNGLCNMCEMLVAGTPPQIKTEATFQAKAGLGGSQFHPAVRGHYLRRAADAGVTTEGRVYEPRLAAFPGAPEAWISNQDEMKSLAERRGYSISGDVTPCRL